MYIITNIGILLYKFKSLLSMTVKYYLYAYNIKEKILFLPQTNFEEMKEIKLNLGKYRTL